MGPIRTVATAALLLTVGYINVVHAAVRLPHVFGDGMVLQRDKPAPVWGWAEPGEKISVKFAGQEQKTVTAADGNWMVRLKPLQVSSEPRTLTVSGANTVSFQNVVVGDVWLCSGDLGMSYKVYACADGAKELAAAGRPNLRLLHIAPKTSNTPLHDIRGDWMVSTSESAADFSGLAYFFGRELQSALKTPIGLIDCSYNYSYMRTWIAPDGLRLIPELKKPRERMESWDSTTEAGRLAYGAAVAQIEQWLPTAAKALQDGKPLPPQPLLPAPITARDENFNSIGELSVAFHGMVEPLIPFAIRGALWSQGENGGESDLETPYLQGLAAGWRKAWGQGEFPFYYELLAQVNKPVAWTYPGDSWTAAREGQIKGGIIPNSGMVVTTDVSDYSSDNRNRQDAGRRFALLALAREYHQNIEYSGPIYRTSRVEADSIIVSFDHIGKGLMAADKKGLEPPAEIKYGPLQHFAIAGADKKWMWAEARIVGDTITVRSDKVAAPVAVRYAWSANPQAANLYNRDGLPAAPFRTDNW